VRAQVKPRQIHPALDISATPAEHPAQAAAPGVDEVNVGARHECPHSFIRLRRLREPSPAQ
jgi:hypothetical protein